MKIKDNLLNKEQVLKNISKNNIQILSDIKILKKTGSTNDDIKNILNGIISHDFIYFVISEQQTSGKGTKGKKWYSPYGKNIYLSMGWKSKFPLSKFSGLSISAAIEIVNSLNKELNLDLNIKWPNDLMLKGKKAGGILVETSSDKKETKIVIGVGINVLMSNASTSKIDQEWTSLIYHVRKSLDRNRLAALIIDSLLNLSRNYSRQGFRNYRTKFKKLNFLKGKECKIKTEKNSYFIGKVLGISNKGELIVKNKDKEHLIRSSANLIEIN